MKKIVVAALILLMLALAPFPSIPKVSANTTEQRHVTYAPDVPDEPMPENSTVEDYLNTTNPYSNLASPLWALDEVDYPEGNHPLYVLVFGDEEERSIYRRIPGYGYVGWDTWARFHMERGDEALVENFGIDIRILGLLEWDSDDNIQYMTDPSAWDLCDELLADKGYYLRTWYNGPWWSNYVDAIIGITAQANPSDPGIVGVSASFAELGQGKIFNLLKWQVYWMDDNLVQHEASHLYYANDHYPTCCAMAYHPHFQAFIYEDWAFWWVFWDIPCSFTAYSWCTTCFQVIQQNSGRYPLRTLTIRCSPYFGGYTNPVPGSHYYSGGSTVTVMAYAYLGYAFDHWVLDGATNYDNPITVTMNSNHTLEAIFIKLVNLVVEVPRAPPEGVIVWVDGNLYRAYANAPVNVMIKPGQHTIEVQKSFDVEMEGIYYIYIFERWSDGSKDNPRTISITSDKTLTAYYVRLKYGIASENPA